jgi:hypothetical protein
MPLQKKIPELICTSSGISRFSLNETAAVHDLVYRASDFRQVSWLVDLSTLRTFPAMQQPVVCRGFRPHSQWRARIGFSPISLFSLFRRQKPHLCLIHLPIQPEDVKSPIALSFQAVVSFNSIFEIRSYNG